MIMQDDSISKYAMKALLTTKVNIIIHVCVKVSSKNKTNVYLLVMIVLIYNIETMLRLLGFELPTRQWRELKTSIMKGEDSSNVKGSKAPHIRQANMFQVAKLYIIDFAERHKNFQPVDNNDSKDENKSEVIIPFESVREFHK